LAANQGDADAQYNLGVLCYQGHGVAQSNDMARKWYLKAALQEHEDAINNLKFIDEEEGKTTPTLPCCATCGTPKTTRRPLHACSQCHTTHYCNRECQMAHWKEGGHKRACKRLKAAAEAEAAKKKALSLPKKKKEDDINKEEAAGDKDGADETTTTTTTATTTTMTATTATTTAAAAGSSPVPPKK
jgi:TPR repeat protein